MHCRLEQPTSQSHPQAPRLTDLARMSDGRIKAPFLHGSVVRADARYSRCDHDAFLTSRGVGRLYWDGRSDGTADHISIGRPDHFGRLETSVFCFGSSTRRGSGSIRGSREDRPWRRRWPARLSDAELRIRDIRCNAPYGRYLVGRRPPAQFKCHGPCALSEGAKMIIR